MIATMDTQATAVFAAVMYVIFIVAGGVALNTVGDDQWWFGSIFAAIFLPVLALFIVGCVTVIGAVT